MPSRSSQHWTENRISSFIGALDSRVSPTYHDPISWARARYKSKVYNKERRHFYMGLMYTIPEYWKAMFDPEKVILFKDASDKRYPVRLYDVQAFHVAEKGVRV